MKINRPRFLAFVLSAVLPVSSWCVGPVVVADSLSLKDVVTGPIKIGRRTVVLPAGSWQLFEKSERTSNADGPSQSATLMDLEFQEIKNDRISRILHIVATKTSHTANWLDDPCKSKGNSYWMEDRKRGMNDQFCLRVDYLSGVVDAAHGAQYETWARDINAEEETFHFAQKCLAARRLLERGVRFVQVWSGNDNGFPRRNWDSHEDIARDHGPLSLGMARGCAAFIQDLKQRGMLDDTVILWTTEFGRMPSSQGGKGRDHNPYVFTNWLAGGGIKGGITHGESDQWGYKPLDRKNPTEVHDIHATILHLLGIDHTKLTFRHNGIDRRLTDVHGEVIRPLLA